MVSFQLHICILAIEITRPKTFCSFPTPAYIISLRIHSFSVFSLAMGFNAKLYVINFCLLFPISLYCPCASMGSFFAHCPTACAGYNALLQSYYIFQECHTVMRYSIKFIPVIIMPLLMLQRFFSYLRAKHDFFSTCALVLQMISVFVCEEENGGFS